MLTAQPVQAASPTSTNEDVLQEIKQLKQRVDGVEAQLQKTEKKLIEAQHELIDAQADANKSSNIKFSNKTGTPKIISPDGQSSVRLFGRIQMEIASIPDQNASGSTDEEDIFSSFTGAEIRRARLGVNGKFFYDWGYELEVDFAGNEIDLKKAQLTYMGWKDSDLRLGFQRVAFGLENTQSSKYTLFMERGLTDAFSPDRDLGIAWHQSKDWGQYKVGIYLPNSITELEDDGPGHRADATTYIGRFTTAPYNNSNRVLHLGASLAYSNFSNKEDIRFRTAPESHLSEKLVSTSKILDPDYTQRYGVEAAYSSHGFLLQTEYTGVSTKGHYDEIDEAIDTYDYSAWYFLGAYMLTGEAHPYRASGGVFGNVKPDHPLSKDGMGALEIALRFSSINLNDNGEKGGKMDDITLGLNWYMENNLKLMVNYVHYEAKDYKENKRITQQDDNIIQTRLQLFF